MRALIVDDSRAARALLGRMMRDLGFDVLEAGHGRDGLARLRETGPAHLALVDWNMPEMNGLEFVEAVRACAGYEDMRLIMVTSETEIARVASALEAGASEYIMKPFTLDVLREKLELVGLPTA